MKDVLLLLGLFVGIFLVLILQELLPAFSVLGGARIQLVPLLFCMGALLFSYPLMLLLAIGVGFLFDLMQLQFVGDRPEIALGTSILFFLLLGVICQGVRPLFLRGQWWLLSLLGGLSTMALPTLQYMLISFRRFETGGLLWTAEVGWRIFLPGVIAVFLAPLFLLFFHSVGAELIQRHRRPLYS